MPEENNAQPRRYCTNCGTEVRPNNAFCTSCGAGLASPPAAGSGQPGPRAPSPGSASSFADALSSTFRRVSGSLRGPSLPGVGSASGIPGRAWRRFRGLPLAAQAALAALVLLSLLAILSPLGAVLAAVVFGVSLIVLIIRVAQRRSAVRWGITAVTSLVLALVLSGVAGIFYGGGSTAETGSSKQEPMPEDGGLQVKPAPAHGDVAPGLERLANRWASSNIESPLFVPSQLPNPPSKVGDNFTDSGFGHPLYAIYGWNYALTLTYAGHPGDGSYRADVPGVGMLTMDDGRSYYYVVEKEDPYYGAYSVAFWNESTFVYKLETSDISIYTPEQFMRTLESMVRVESRGTV